ncbi:MAG TPA: glycosyltransferase [Parafilimonas sp.]|nr:glycosyltransferase [Parafilimonas sp.]
MNTNPQRKRVLIAPLDWGLGHATRCLVIIRALQKFNCDITVAASGKIKSLIQNEFPNLYFLDLQGYNISYSRSKRTLPFKILLQIPKILKIIRFENKWLSQIIETKKFDAVISDNRFGFHTKQVASVFMTHQLQIETNFWGTKTLLRHLNYQYINRFRECWVPDFADSLNISGQLSHPEILPAIPVKYLGPLSRFMKSNRSALIKFKYVAIISGPEPQRSVFEKKIIEVASKTDDEFLLVRGLPGERESTFLPSNCKAFNHLNTNEMAEAIESGEFVVSRCGYTTVMEILSLQKKSILIPTPGQTEQEYLAKHLLKQNWCYTFNQEDDFAFHLQKAKSFEYKLPEMNMHLHEDIIAGFINALQ